MKNSHIAWTTHTFNHVMGCAMVSDECVHCYAKDSMPVKMQGIPWGKGKPRKRTSEQYWRDPIAWDRLAEKAGRQDRVFCASLADVFDEDIRIKDTADLLELTTKTPNLNWLFLTKRIENFTETMKAVMRFEDSPPVAQVLAEAWLYGGKAPANIWLGVSMGREKYFERLERLCRIPAVIRFVSNEPALERINWEECFRKLCAAGLPIPDWLITGGESGREAREYEILWGVEIIDVCREWGVTPFFKQTGSKAYGHPVDWVNVKREDNKHRIILKHPKGGDPEEWPEWLRVQQIPKPRSAVHPHA